MEPRANYFIVGLFVIGLTALAIVGTLWFSAGQHKVRYTYLVYMKESVSGLSVQAPVKFNGVEVGSVTNIDINPDNPQQVRLFLSIQEGTPIDQSTRALLMTQGITGVMFVGLKAGAAKAPPLEIKPGEEYPVIQSEPSVLVELDAALREMTLGVHSISVRFQELLSPDNQKSIHDTLAHISKVSGVFADRSQELSSSLKNLDGTLQDSQAAIQNFSQQALPGMLNTMTKFNNVLNQVEPLAKTLQDNPSALLRGKTQGAPGPGE